MSEAADRGISVTKINAMDDPIDVAPETTTAFVGRALRGPLNTPVLVEHFGDFRRRFGDAWSRSSLGPAVKQYFEHGGLRLYIVRVANNARGAMLCLPASGSALILRAVEPGSTESLRAAVDYDGIDVDNDSESFNLTLQRMDPVTGLIVDQEIFPQVSYSEDSESFVADSLLTSTIARAEAPYPQHRPDETVSEGNRYELQWVTPVQQGTDGDALTDYDLIGSRERGSGLFALQQVPSFDILYLPPPGKDADTGPAAVLAAEQYSRERGAMLIVDPKSTSTDARIAVNSVRMLGYASPNILGYYPRVHIRGDGDKIARTAGGAIAGLLSKLDRTHGPWQDLNHSGLGLHRAIKPALQVDDDEAAALNRAGINVLRTGPAGKARVTGAVTMGRGTESQRMFASLPVHRLCLKVINTIDVSTRWTVFEQPDRRLTERIQAQVLTYLSTLNDLGAFENDRFVVQCDAGVARFADSLEHGVTILIVFQPRGCVAPISFTLHQTVHGCRVATSAFAPVADDGAEDDACA